MTTDSMREISAINRARCNRWHPGYPETVDVGDWTGGDWSNAMGGEVGEMADAAGRLSAMMYFTSLAGRLQDTVKKMRRHDVDGGAMRYNTPELQDLRRKFIEEAADTFLYWDLTLGKFDISMDEFLEVLAEKFNMVSEVQNFPERLPR